MEAKMYKIVLVALLTVVGTTLLAQEQDKKEKEREKALQEQKALQQEMEAEIQFDNQHELELIIQNATEAAAEAGERIRMRYDELRDEGFITEWDGPDVQVLSTGHEPFFVWGGQGSSSSSLNLSKTYTGESKENSGSFQVDESVRRITMNINGNVKSGSITIKILLPGGKVLKEVTLDDSANMTFSQSIRIAEEETKYYGDWKYTIAAEKCDGRYQLMISTH